MSPTSPLETPAAAPEPGNAAEQRLLRLSIAVTVLLALANMAAGLWLGSRTIVFDGVYGLADTVMTVLALVVSRLIARGDDRRFQFGYWHLEPLLTAVNGIVLALACAYGALDGINGLLHGGNDVAGVPATLIGLGNGVVSLAMAGFLVGRARRLDSQLLRTDLRAWTIGGVFGLGIGIAFAAAEAIDATLGGMARAYADPLILAVLALALLPLPIGQIIEAMRDILQITPAALDAEVAMIAAEVAAAHGFVDSRSHVVRSGRVQFVEIGLLAPPDWSPGSMAALDRVREDIAARLGGRDAGRWLTVDFTADERWI
ncbi:hypothetical protein IP88_08335 [alpha proteobacterium AAP81b]|nr:hypothetical protein IP88_08335 [alpha proteobacterium AAP81b]